MSVFTGCNSNAHKGESQHKYFYVQTILESCCALCLVLLLLLLPWPATLQHHFPPLPTTNTIRGPGDLWSGTKQSGKQSHLSAITMRQLQADPHIMEHARMAAAEMIRTIGQNPQLKAALLAYGFMFVPEGETMAVARYGVSGM